MSKVRLTQIDELINELGLCDKCREIAYKADWYNDMKSPSLSEYYRYAHRTVCDFIDSVRAECSTLEDIFELIELKQLVCRNDYVYYKSEGFMHFAELAMVANSTLSWFKYHIPFKNSKAVNHE